MGATLLDTESIKRSRTVPALPKEELWDRVSCLHLHPYYLKDVVWILHETKALLCAHWLLRSGGHSRYMLQLPRIAQLTQHLSWIGKLLVGALADRIPKLKPKPGQKLVVDAVLCRPTSALYLGQSVCRELETPYILTNREGTGLRSGFSIEKHQRLLIITDQILNPDKDLEPLVGLAHNHGAEVLGVGVFAARSPLSLEEARSWERKIPQFCCLVHLDLDHYGVGFGAICPACQDEEYLWKEEDWN